MTKYGFDLKQINNRINKLEDYLMDNFSNISEKEKNEIFDSIHVLESIANDETSHLQEYQEESSK